MDKTQHESFQWHPDSSLRCIRNHNNETAQSPVSILNATHYIADVDCVSTLKAVQQVVLEQSEFCVHPPMYQPSANTASRRTATDEAFFQCLSSGSNGQPKRIRRTHASWIASFNMNANAVDIRVTDSYAIVGRASHSLGLYAALEAAYLGADIHAIGDLRADRQLQAMTALGSTILYATPTQLRLLCTHAIDHRNQPTAIRHIFCGGGKLDSKTTDQISSCFPKAIVQEFYGASETSFISISDAATPAGSVGKAYPGVDIKIEPTSSNGNATEAGEIWVKSPYVFHSYADQNDHAAVWRDGYVSVGEIGHIDESGYLFLAGRQSRRVNIADTVVYPEAIENLLNEHAAVQMCAVIPVYDEKRGCVLQAVVEANNNAITEQALLAYLRQSVGNLKSPRTVTFVSSLPLLASGKPDLVAIENQWAKIE